jgi:hypothetical protein
MAVELFDPNHRYGAPAGAKLTYRGGPLMSNTKVVGVFVNELDGSPYAETAGVTAFLQDYGSLTEQSELVEYDQASYVQEASSFLGGFAVSLGGSTPPPPPPPPGGDCSAELDALLACLGFSSPSPVRAHLAAAHRKHRKPAPAAGTTLTDADVHALIEANLSALPAVDDDTLYAVFFPTGVTIQADSQNASCQQFCGYHDSFVSQSGANIRYAVLPFPDCAGCMGGLPTALDAITGVTSHEIAEAENDPQPGSGWYDDANGEIGDICAWTFRSEKGHNVQLLWSNKHNACI